MTEDIISMDDMMAIYEVTDRFGIDRENISVPLEKIGKGAVAKGLDGIVEIVAPAFFSTRSWLVELQREVENLGFEPQEIDDNEWET